MTRHVFQTQLNNSSRPSALLQCDHAIRGRLYSPSLGTRAGLWPWEHQGQVITGDAASTLLPGALCDCGRILSVLRLPCYEEAQGTWTGPGEGEPPGPEPDRARHPQPAPQPATYVNFIGLLSHKQPPSLESSPLRPQMLGKREAIPATPAPTPDSQLSQA